MGRVLLGVVVSKRIANDIKKSKFNISKYLEITQFKVLNLDSMQVEDAGINDIGSITNFNFDVSNNIATVKVAFGKCCYAEDTVGNSYIVFCGDELVENIVYLQVYEFKYFEVIFDYLNKTYEIAPKSKRCSSFELSADFSNIEFTSICSLGYKLSYGMYILGDIAIIGEMSECVIVPNGVKTVYFEGEIAGDLDFSIVIPPSVDKLVFKSWFWAMRAIEKHGKIVRVALPSSKFNKLYKTTVNRIEADYKIAIKRHSLSDARYFEYIDSLDKERVLKLAGISIDRY